MTGKINQTSSVNPHPVPTRLTPASNHFASGDTTRIFLSQCGQTRTDSSISLPQCGHALINLPLGRSHSHDRDHTARIRRQQSAPRLHSPCTSVSSWFCFSVIFHPRPGHNVVKPIVTFMARKLIDQIWISFHRVLNTP